MLILYYYERRLETIAILTLKISFWGGVTNTRNVTAWNLAAPVVPRDDSVELLTVVYGGGAPGRRVQRGHARRPVRSAFQRSVRPAQHRPVPAHGTALTPLLVLALFVHCLHLEHHARAVGRRPQGHTFTIHHLHHRQQDRKPCRFGHAHPVQPVRVADVPYQVHPSHRAAQPVRNVRHQELVFLCDPKSDISTVSR